MNATTLMKDSFEPIKKEFEGVESSVFANRRLKYLDREIEKKMPEMELLNPEERIRRLQPLENQLTEQQKRINSLNVDYRLNNMDELKEQGTELAEMADVTVADMTKINTDLKEITDDMKIIAHGLGYGLSPGRKL